MFRFFKDQFSKIYNTITTKLQSLFASNDIDERALAELERILLEADTGINTTRLLLNRLKDLVKSGTIRQGQDLKSALEDELKKILQTCSYKGTGSVYLLVGVNGTGKTTFAAKLAHTYIGQGKKVLLAAADTFRAAAVEQMQSWADKIGASCTRGIPQADPASVVFNACQRFVAEAYDVLIIDTAGRLQNKEHLMRELKKVRNVIDRQLPNASVVTLLTLDAMLGQNSFDQARLFGQAAAVDGIVLTKMDGTGKGGIVFAICRELAIPLAYVSYGEQLNQIALFDADSYVKQLLDG